MGKINTKLNQPKRFGEILDLTFSLSKNNFKDFFTILLIFMGPLYLLQAIISLASGVSFFRDVGVGGTWYEGILTSFDTTETTSLSDNLGLILIGFISIFIIPVASAAILLAVNHIRKNEEYTVGSVIKQAFSRYGPILGSSFLFMLIALALIIVPSIILSLISVIAMATLPVVGIIVSIVLFLGFAVAVAYLLTRWSFYFSSTVLGEGTPGFSRSWRLTRKHTWKLMALFIIFVLLVTIISTTVELTFSMLLGNSVLLTLIVSLATIFTTTITSVGYAVIYLDLKVRHDADDLKEMIEDYQEVQS